MADSTFSIPPLSDLFSRLLALSAEERANARLLELMAHKDPAAVARLLQLANSVAFRPSGKPVVNVRDAMTVLGTGTVVDTLMGLWAFAELDAAAQYAAFKEHLVRHTFSLCATMRRLVQHVGAEAPDSFLDLQLTVLLDKLALATYLSAIRPQPQAAALLTAPARQQRHAWHQDEDIAVLFERSTAIARAWQASAAVQTHLTELQHWRTLRFKSGPVTQAIVLGELFLELPPLGVADENPYEAALDDAYEESTLMHTLVARRVNPVTLPVRF